MKKIIQLFVFIFLFTLFLSNILHAKDRCQDFIPDVRQYSIQYLGFQYPYWYNIGLMIAESNCRSDVISFDGGIGLFQLTPLTGITAEISKHISINPHNVQSNIRGGIFYISRIINVHFQRESAKVHNKYNVYPKKYVKFCGLNLGDVYRFYNGGYWFFYEASRKEGIDYICENREMFKYCVRGGTYTDKAKTKWLSFCEVNYSYPEKVFKYSQKYRVGPDGIKFWHVKPTR